MISGTFDPNVASQVTTIMKKALDDFDKGPIAKIANPANSSKQ